MLIANVLFSVSVSFASFALPHTEFTQIIECYGNYQVATLVIHKTRAEVRIVDENTTFSASLPYRKSFSDETVVFSNLQKTIRVTIPEEWLGHAFPRFSKTHPRKGFLIKEMTSFEILPQTRLALRECESSIDLMH